MSSYTYPETPLPAAVWFECDGTEPAGGADALIDISLSPVRPEDFLRATPPLGELNATHIIRCAPDPRLADNFVPGEPATVFPATLWEYPIGSKHFYATLWAHQIGTGFPNHHARVYVTRWIFGRPFPLPIFTGWV